MAWRFKVLQQACERSRNVVRMCRHFGISRQAFYRWKRRYETPGTTGPADWPSTPKATSREVVSKILYLRQTYQFGPGKITDYRTVS
jgi:transposase-like protein